MRVLEVDEVSSLAPNLDDLVYWAPFRGLSFDGDPLRIYYRERAVERALSASAISVGAFSGNRLVGFQVSDKSSFLTDYFDVGSGSITFTALPHGQNEQQTVAELLCKTSISALKSEGVELASASTYTSEKALTWALQGSGFRLVEVFANYAQDIASIEFPRVSNDTVIRDCIEEDLGQIKQLYEGETFPGRLVSDPNLPRDTSYALYGRRFEEVFENKLGRIFVAERQGKLVGALIGIVDGDLFDATGIKTNLLSGMGIIIDPASRGLGIATSLISERMRWYQNEGVESVSFGASIDNVPMIRGLTKLGMEFTSSQCAFHAWL